MISSPCLTALTAWLLLASAGCHSVSISGFGSAGGTSTGTAASTGTSTGTSSGGGGSTTSGTGASPIGVGPCTANDQCLSGMCGLDGTGDCCSAACSTTDPICGATGCDAQIGTCTYAAAGVPCGSPACAGDVLNDPGVCDGRGSCDPDQVTCAPYVCEDEACLTSCETSAQCASGSFCDTLNAVCCSGLTPEGAIQVDSDRGADGRACCGIDSHRACQTITQAMRLIDSAQARDVTIHATVLAGLWDKGWLETYPIVLGWGADLQAPGMNFDEFNAPAGAPAEVFDIARYSPADTVAYASLSGGNGPPVTLSNGQTAVQVENGSHLYIANAYLNAGVGINMLPTGSLTLGQNRSGAASGTVLIGSKEPANGSFGNRYGITCFSDDAGNGCTIDDAAPSGKSSVIIRDQAISDILAEDGSVISLTSAPVIGVTPGGLGFQGCPSNVDTTSGTAAVYLQGRVAMTFENGTVQCIKYTGFELQPTEMGSPTLTIENAVVQNTLRAIVVADGLLTIGGSTIRFNQIGVEVEGNASADLSGGQLGGVNTIACNFGNSTVGGGFSVASYGDHVVDASNVAWDTPGPNIFTCTDAGVCTCVVTDCTDLGSAGIVKDAVSFNPSPAVITTGNTLSSLKCE